MRLRFLRRWRRRRPAGAIAVICLVVFVVILAVWVGSSPTGSDNVAIPSTTPFPQLSESISPAASPSGASGTESSKNTAALPDLPALPQLTSGVDISREQGRHQITLIATSDTTILQVRFGIRGGDPARGHYTGVASPLRVLSPARGNGVLAVLQVQSSYYAKGAGCSIYVDGILRSHNYSKGAITVATCVA
jgi:hypothetical protein